MSDIRRAMRWLERLPSVDEGPWCAHVTEILVWIQRADAAMNEAIDLMRAGYTLGAEFALNAALLPDESDAQPKED